MSYYATIFLHYIKYQSTLHVADALVGTWLAVSQRTRLAETNTSKTINGDSMLLLLERVQEQHREPKSKASEGFPNIADALQKEAWFKAIYVSQVWEAFGRKG